MPDYTEALRQRRQQRDRLVHEVIPMLQEAQQEGSEVNLGSILKVSREISGDITDMEREGKQPFGFWKR